MDSKLLFIAISVVFFSEVECIKQSGLLNGLTKGLYLHNGYRSNIEFMNENNRYDWYHSKVPDSYQPAPYGQLYQLPYRNLAWPLPYRYLSSNIYGNINQPKEYVMEKVNGQGINYKQYLEELPEGLTYVVTEHVNYGHSNVKPAWHPTKKPITFKPETTKIACSTKNPIYLSATTPVSHVVNNGYNKDDSIKIKENEQSIDVKPVKEPAVQAFTLEEGPDVMMSDGDHTTHSRAVWKREIKSGVPVDVLFDGTLLNMTETEANVSQFLTNLFEDLDENAMLELISTLKEEYLSSATPEESKIIEDTFSKLIASLSNRRNSQDEKTIDKKTTEEKLKSDLIAEAAGVLELLAEETSLKDTSEGFFDDESYLDYYSDVSEESDAEDTSEPSFLELLSLAKKHKASKGLINDKKA